MSEVAQVSESFLKTRHEFKTLVNEKFPQYISVEGKRYQRSFSYSWSMTPNLREIFKIFYAPFDEDGRGADMDLLFESMAAHRDICIEKATILLGRYLFTIEEGPWLTKAEQFTKDLTSLLNRYSKENRSDTPDFILAAYLESCLRSYENTTQQLKSWKSN